MGHIKLENGRRPVSKSQVKKSILCSVHRTILHDKLILLVKLFALKQHKIHQKTS